jgi:hypothetical protein
MYGAKVVFPKQLMVAAVANALRAGRHGNLADRAKIETEFESMLEAGSYEGLGWSVFDAADRLDPRVRETIQEAITTLVRTEGPTSGDELTFLVSRQVMRKFSPRLLIVIFSDAEVAHFGSYALHVAGIRTGDRLAYQLWQEIQATSEYQGKTIMVILPEFGRDPDGSTTNGFFNHRGDTESTRSTWMMALGATVGCRKQVGGLRTEAGSFRKGRGVEHTAQLRATRRVSRELFSRSEHHAEGSGPCRRGLRSSAQG